jgi:hydrogenase maturation factor
MTVCEVDERDGLAVCVDPDGVRSPVEIALVPPVAVGDQLLVHAGVAIVALGTEEAVA